MTELAQVQHLDWREIVTAKDGTSAAVTEALAKYFEAFAPPTMKETDGKKVYAEQACIKCDEPLTGMAAALFGRGGFEWGIVHGEGFCRNCHWPSRAHHFIKDETGETFLTLRNFILQYHPDYVSVSA